MVGKAFRQDCRTMRRILTHLAPCLIVAVRAAATAVFISLSEKAEMIEPWDGSVRGLGGDLIRLEEHHFTGDDRLAGPSWWRVPQ